MSFGRHHVASSLLPPVDGTQPAACGEIVKDARRRYSDIELPICKKCAEKEAGEVKQGRRYFTFLIDGQRFINLESEG